MSGDFYSNHLPVAVIPSRAASRVRGGSLGYSLLTGPSLFLDILPYTPLQLPKSPGVFSMPTPLATPAATQRRLATQFKDLDFAQGEI
jgi:hypothetical protein